ncbi:hypothetical protein FV222_20480 [Methylobacterium sp. WL103]|nr:hypothetical protein FV222_20480 [Methylobacterium sp. WL103]
MPPPARPPHRRLPPRFADDEVVEALSPHAGRGDARTSNRQGQERCEYSSRCAGKGRTRGSRVTVPHRTRPGACCTVAAARHPSRP